MKKRSAFLGTILLIIIAVTGCLDPLEDFQVNSENNSTDKRYKAIDPSMKYFHNDILRGVTVNPWISNIELDKIVEETGANIIRLGFGIEEPLMYKTPSSGSGSTGVYNFNEDAFGALERILDWAEKENVKILIDPHTFPGFNNAFTTSASDPFWHDIRWRDHMIKLWVEIIDRIGSRGDIIAGYDLLNEPQIPDPNLCAYGNQWNNLIKILVDTIRSKGDDHPIIIEPAGIVKGLNCGGLNGMTYTVPAMQAFSELELPNDDNLVISPHFYAPHKFTHQGITGFGPSGVRYPGNIINDFGQLEYWDKDRLEDEFDELKYFVNVRYPNTPVYVGEFSVSRAGGSDGDIFLNDFFEMADDEGWSWTYHGWDSQSNEWHPSYHYSVPFNNSSPPLKPADTAPRLNLLRQYTYQNFVNYPQSDKMINGLYRLSHTDGEQLLTYNLTEVSIAYFDYGYKIDGVYGRVAPEDNSYTVPVYKLRHTTSGDRLFTTSLSERNAALLPPYNYTDEGIGFYASTSQTLNNDYIAVYRFQKGAFHRYAMGISERDAIITANNGWTYESDRTFYIRRSKLY